MIWRLFLDDDAEKDLDCFPKRDREKIKSAVLAMKINPYAGDIQRMKGEKDVWRRRIGAYRVFYEIRLPEKTIYIFNIERRTSSTY